uniref:Uncharacterized protein n=1 Tax=Parascaris univalens TaxID=6257 RepID=A0A914ZV29_PARUN
MTNISQRDEVAAEMDLPKFMEQKEKIRKAQSLYEPWMDNMAMVEESKEYVAPPPRHPHAKHRSQFTFDSEYLKTDSKTPTSPSKLLIETDYTEFYAWVLNGKETDLSTSEIVRLIFDKIHHLSLETHQRDSVLRLEIPVLKKVVAGIHRRKYGNDRVADSDSPYLEQIAELQKKKVLTMQQQLFDWKLVGLHKKMLTEIAASELTLHSTGVLGITGMHS